MGRLDRRVGSDVREPSRIEHKPEKPAHLPEVDALIRVGCAMHNDQIEFRDHDGILTTCALGIERAFRQVDDGRDAVVDRGDPPQIAVARAPFRSRVGLYVFIDPARRDDLATFPLALGEVQQEQNQPNRVSVLILNGYAGYTDAAPVTYSPSAGR